jgi:drug/metabolite transporter (DMT)-like permease
VIVVGLINYLWPSLSLLFSIPVLGHRARPHLAVGVPLALAGIWLAAGAGQGLTVQEILTHGRLLPYTLALAAAVSWGLYSNLSRRWAGGSSMGGVPLFLLASGVLLGGLRLFAAETPVWSGRSALVLLYMALLPGFLAYFFWDLSVRKGDLVLVVSLSYLAPLLSTLVSSVVLGVLPSVSFWLGVVCVILGAAVCRSAIVDTPAPTRQAQ